jgi:hypothetical protein
MKYIPFTILLVFLLALPVDAVSFTAPTVPESGREFLSGEPETFGEGAGLPEILPEDEGKILGVQGGQWEKVQADFSGADWDAESGQNGFIKNKPDLDKFATKQ